MIDMKKPKEISIWDERHENDIVTIIKNNVRSDSRFMDIVKNVVIEEGDGISRIFLDKLIRELMDLTIEKCFESIEEG